MNIQKIAIKKLRAIFVNSNKAERKSADKTLKMQLQAEAMKLGFIFTDKAVNELASNNSNYTDIFQTLSELVGADKTWKPMYRNFPEEVFEMSDVELYLNAITHYWTFGTWMPETTSSKVPVFEKTDFKKIDVCYPEDIEKLFKNILASNGSITEFDKEVVAYAVTSWNNKSWMNEVEISFKETLCFFTGLLFEHKVELQKYPSIKTATDVLRIACAFSPKGDISLTYETTFKLTNSQRKFIVKILEPVIKEEEIAKYKHDWICLFHLLHIGTFKNAPKCNAIAQKLRNEKVRTLNSELEIALATKDEVKISKLLLRNMGDFARRLDHVLRLTQNEAYINLFFDHAEKVDTRVLIQMLSHFKERNGKKMRVVIPKGNTINARVLSKQKEMSPYWISSIIQKIGLELKKRFQQKESLGKVYVSRSLKKAPVPLQMRTASDGLYVMQRGTKLPLNKDKSILRFFIHWIGRDIDLSACFLKEDLSYHSVVAYYNLRSDGKGLRAAHSGDITYAPGPDGACEFLDIDLTSVDTTQVRYVAMDVRVFAGETFESQQATAGWMMRDELAAKRGEIFDAKTVEQRISLTSKTNAIVALFDLKEREVIWLDMEGQSSMFRPNNVASNKATIKNVAEIAVNFSGTSLYDLLVLHAESRGTLVSNKKDADLIFEKDWIFKYTDILAEYL